MKKLTQKGFSAVEGLLIVLLLALVGGIGYYVYNQSQKQDETSKSQGGVQTQIQAAAYKRTTKVPEDWKIYENKDYKISLSYPGDWSVSENTFDKKKGQDDQNVFSINATKIFVICFKEEEHGQWCPAQININNQSLEDSMKELRKYYKDNNDNFTEKNITLDGHPAVEVTSGKQKDYYVSANSNTYALTTVYESEKDAKMHEMTPEESLQLLESIKIKNN